MGHELIARAQPAAAAAMREQNNPVRTFGDHQLTFQLHRVGRDQHALARSLDVMLFHG